MKDGLCYMYPKEIKHTHNNIYLRTQLYIYHICTYISGMFEVRRRKKLPCFHWLLTRRKRVTVTAACRFKHLNVQWSQHFELQTSTIWKIFRGPTCFAIRSQCIIWSSFSLTQCLITCFQILNLPIISDHLFSNHMVCYYKQCIISAPLLFKSHKIWNFEPTWCIAIRCAVRCSSRRTRSRFANWRFSDTLAMDI